MKKMQDSSFTVMVSSSLRLMRIMSLQMRKRPRQTSMKRMTRRRLSQM